MDGTTTVTTTLDAEGRAIALAEGMGRSGPYTGRLGYNLNDLPITMTLPGGSGITEGMGYDVSSRLGTMTLAGPASSPATTTLSSAYAYGYNPLNWTTSTTTLSGTDTLVHDARSRLTSESGPQVVATGGAYKWTYDANGNLLSQLGDDGYPVTYTYTSAITPNQLQTMVMGDGQPTASYGYDGHGDTTAITDGNLLNTHLVYDSQARPTQITTLDHRNPVTVTLTYNPSGQRASYHVVEPNQPTLDQQFTYRNGVLGQVRLSSGATAYTDTYLYTDAGAPYELLRTTSNGATSRYWYEVDGRGNVVALTDSTGKVVDRYAYDSWGELTSDDSVNETVPQQLRYAGYWYDEKLSWYWLSVRYYDPEIERFLAPDPSKQDGVCTYRYVADDPIDATDPSGLCSPKPAHINYWRFQRTLAYMWQQMHDNSRSNIVHDIHDMIYEASHPNFVDLFNPNYQQELLNQAFAEWFIQVRAGGAWDHKPILDRMLGLGSTPPHGDYYFPIPGDPQHEWYYDIWSNIHYGYVGSAAGFDPDTLIRVANINTPFTGVNDAGDDVSTRMGIELWQKYGPSLTPTELYQYILNNEQRLIATNSNKVIPGCNWV